MIPVSELELSSMPGPNQIMGEWKTYLQFLQKYCKKFRIKNPIVVEVGVQMGKQKQHYEKFLDAIHIGIDIEEKYSKPDILGDSHNPDTVRKLKEVLNGRKINFLFLDGMHTYLDTIADYYAYGPMTKDVIAFHDIRHEKEIGRMWVDLQMANTNATDKSFISIGGVGNGWCELGIGVFVKRSKENLLGVING